MITPEQTRALDEGVAVPFELEGRECVILTRKAFDRVRAFLYDDGEWSHEELRAALTRSFRNNGWDEPAMEEYDRYDEFKK